MSKCPRCGEEGAIDVGNIDGYGKLCVACIYIYTEEVDILTTICKKQEEENDSAK